MRNQVYSGYFYQMLMEYGKVSIPSLGTFSLDHTNAAFSDDRKLLHPPVTGVYFTPEQDDRFQFSGLLTEKGMRADDAQSIQKQMADDYLTAQNQNSPFEISTFGTLVNRIFLPKDNNVFNKYWGLQPVVATVAPKKAEHVVHDDNYLFNLQNSYATTSDVSSSQGLLWPSLIALGTILIILCWFFCPKSIPSASSSAQTVIPQESVTTIVTDTITASTESVITKDSTSTETMSRDSIGAQILDDNSALPKVSTKSKSAGECVVIVGAFKNKANANKMVRLIKAKGYHSYQQSHEGLQRVGISYNCASTDPDAFKTKVRTIFNKDAWHLQDTI